MQYLLAIQRRATRLKSKETAAQRQPGQGTHPRWLALVGLPAGSVIEVRVESKATQTNSLCLHDARSRCKLARVECSLHLSGSGQISAISYAHHNSQVWQARNEGKGSASLLLFIAWISNS